MNRQYDDPDEEDLWAYGLGRRHGLQGPEHFQYPAYGTRRAYNLGYEAGRRLREAQIRQATIEARGGDN